MFEFARNHGLGELDDYDYDEAIFEAVMEYITREAGITSFKLRACDLYDAPGLPDLPLLASMKSNYRRADQQDVKLDWDDVSKLQKYLGRTDLPMWYLDMHYPGWGNRTWDSCV